MYEFHLWTAISYHSHDTNPDLQEECVNACKEYFKKNQHLKPSNYTLVRQNGLDTFMMSGLHNHPADYVLEIFKWIGQNAQGSYGLLYVFDDENDVDQENFKVYVMRKGQLSEERDTWLSPRMPTIEDHFNASRND